MKFRRWLEALRDTSGVALAMTVAVVLLILTVSATLYAAVLNEYQTAVVAEESRQALQIAEAGVEKAIFELKRDLDWSDSAAATQEHTPGDTTTWYRLWDGAAYVDAINYPGAAPLGAISVHLRGAASADYPGCNAETCVWVRATGRVRSAARRITVLMGKLLPAQFGAFANNAVNVGAGGGGNGTFTMHGGIYVARCTNMNIAGTIYCVALNLQGDGAILNDTPFIGDTPGSPPYHNRVYARGYVTGQGNSWQIGLDAQPMWGMHAFGWPSAYDNQIDAYHRDNTVPLIPFPDPSALICRIDLGPSCATQTQIVPANALTAFVCTRPGGVCLAGQWQPVDLSLANQTLTLQANARILIPDVGAGINCNGAQAAMCAAASGPADVAGTNNFTVIFNGFLGPGLVNMYAQRDAYIHMESRLFVDTDIRYEGFATFLIESDDNPALEIRGSVTPLCPASQGCAQTFGRPQPAGNTLAFVVGPADPTQPGGGIYARGASLEINLVLMAHGEVGNDQPQDWYGLFIGDVLDFDNNPQLYPVPDLRSNLPPGVAEHMTQGYFGVTIYKWWETF